MKELRDKQYTINLTEGEAQKLEKIAEQEKRKPRELLYILISEILAKK